MIPAGVSELRSAFHAHRQYAETHNNASGYLLLFYAVECGLKAMWLKRMKLYYTEQIVDKTLLGQEGHNVSRWVKELRLSASGVGPEPHFRLAGDKSPRPVKHAHEAWRYGVRIEQADEKALVQWLYQLCHRIAEELP